MKYAKDLHRKGELKKVAAMEKEASAIILHKDMGAAFLTEAYQGFDCIAIIPNSPKYSEFEGYVLFDEELNKPVFIQDKEE